MKKIVIIGGGIAGLSAGIFGQINGFETTVIEKNPIAGGECMGWYRKNHYIDGCIHWLVGSLENTAINDLWKTVGALEHVKIHQPDEFMAVYYQDKVIPIYRDLDILKTEWTKLSPVDEDAINEFCADVKSLHKFDIPCGKPFDLMNLKEKILFLLSMKEAGMIIKKYGKLDGKTFVERFKHPAIQEVFLQFLPEGYSVFAIFFTIAAFTKGQGAIPLGGSLKFSQRIADKYQSLNGNLILGHEVKEIKISGKIAQGVVLDNDQFIEADYVLGACDAHHFYSSLLLGKYNDPKFEKRFANKKDYPLASQVQISLSYQGDLKNSYRTHSIEIQPLDVMGANINRLWITNYAHEDDFAPKGHTLITIAINQYENEVNNWFTLRKDSQGYYQYKNELANQVINRIESQFREMKNKLTVLDVASPITYHRYCNAYRGAFMGFMITTAGKQMSHSGKIKGLTNVSLTGQWLQPPGGLPTALITAKDSIMRICKQEQQEFKLK